MQLLHVVLKTHARMEGHKYRYRYRYRYELRYNRYYAVTKRY